MLNDAWYFCFVSMGLLEVLIPSRGQIALASLKVKIGEYTSLSRTWDVNFSRLIYQLLHCSMRQFHRLKASMMIWRQWYRSL